MFEGVLKRPLEPTTRQINLSRVQQKQVYLFLLSRRQFMRCNRNTSRLSLTKTILILHRLQQEYRKHLAA